MLPGTQPRSHTSWIMTSALLLLIYLAFFHLCIGATYQVCIALGVGSWLVWTIICWYLRGVFWNRFEYFIHQLVGLDLLMEGFIPFHEGYGFYLCAASFWLVFLVNHFVVATRRSATSIDASVSTDASVRTDVLPMIGDSAASDSI